MPVFISSPHRAARRRGALLACFAFLITAFSATHPVDASALGEQCSGADVQGMGAFLQTTAQERWSSPKIKGGFNTSSNPLACAGGQGSGGTPAVSYVALGSPAALRHWGAEDGALHDKEFGFLADFLGTDVAPAGPIGEEGTMLSNMKSALNSDVVVVPVTQTAIAIAANPPALPAHKNCLVSRISPSQLEGVFRGRIKNWRRLSAASDHRAGGDCDQSITRIVREESAGTTYQLKHYLNSVEPAPLSCTGKSKRTWAQLQDPFGGETPPNVEWPSNPGCQVGEGPVTTVAGPEGEGELGSLRYVAEAPGTITYGSLPEARQWAPEQIVDVYNGVHYADPEIGKGEANCAAAKYTLPPEAAGGVDVDWSQVYGSNPKIGKVAKDAYPICTLSWDVAAVKHFGESTATTVHDYLGFVVDKEGGQAAARHVGYQDLPASVAEAAVAAISHIEGEVEEEEPEEEVEEEPEEEEKGGGSATVLCKSEPSLEGGVLTCPPGEGFSGKISGALVPKTVATLESISGPETTITCPEGSYVGEFNEDGTSAGNGITTFEFGQKAGCTTTFPEEPEAVVSFENPPYDASRFEYTNPLEPQGVFTLAKSSKGPLFLRVQSGPLCVYAPNSVEGEVTNGAPTQLHVKSVLKLWEGEKACPAGLIMSAFLTVTQFGEGLPLYIAGKGGGGEEEKGGTSTVLCKATPELKEGVLTCPSGKGFSGEVSGDLVPKTVATFEGVSGPTEATVTCPEGFYIGEFNEDGTSAGNGITTFEFGLKEGCTTTFPEGPEAVVRFENPPYDASRFSYTNPLEPQGVFTLAKASKGPPLLLIKSDRVCVYSAGGAISSQVTNGSTTEMFMLDKWKLVEESPEEACPTVLVSSAHLTVTRAVDSGALFIAGG
jgi:ABC-type phosphate transport system substrate-binding protein